METSIRELLINRKIQVYTTVYNKHGNRVYKLEIPRQTVKPWKQEVVIIKDARINRKSGTIDLYIGDLYALSVNINQIISLI